VGGFDGLDMWLGWEKKECIQNGSVEITWKNVYTEDRKKRREGNIKMDLRETGCENGRWMELAQDRVQWQALVLAVLNLLVLLPQC
jgi:hypothetical protein